ncbi:extracellular solute-binding protein [Candidatus Peregrinibacteria bacterium]|nr:extracellular solute-binding protein [Candidatus Peregrinibacteria bacterium]MBT7703528.1 extracellular solute-binding protein [Candidatus Peregrinibacteria bacterium]
MRKIVAITVILVLTLGTLSGCKKQTNTTTTVKKDDVELTYYRLFDDEDIFEPLIREYESENSHVTINYRKFTDPEQYLDLIINELAEGEGPDIFSMHNTWFTQHRKKLTPIPNTLITTEDFNNVFVSVANDDLVSPDSTGTDQIYGLPMYVDTLALYYNQDHFEDAVPSRGKPASTWEELQEDVYKLTKADNSFERFEVAGIAMGRADNILRAIDILYLLMIQFGTDFYDEAFTEATFADAAGAITGSLSHPGVDALSFFTQFALPSSKYYTWNAYLADDDSAEKEVKTFARGKASMIIGYSYLYEQILDEIAELEKKGQDTINSSTIQIATIPQVEDPETSTSKRDTYASYFAETVARTSENSEEAWKFLSFLVEKENLEHYHTETNRPTSRRDMIEEQAEDATYGIFAEQIGYAESFPIADADAYEEVFAEAIEAVLNTEDPDDVMKDAQEKVNLYMPSEGFYPVTVSTE